MSRETIVLYQRKRITWSWRCIAGW